MIVVNLTGMSVSLRFLKTTEPAYYNLSVEALYSSDKRFIENLITAGTDRYGLSLGDEPYIVEDVLYTLQLNQIDYTIDSKHEQPGTYPVPIDSVP